MTDSLPSPFEVDYETYVGRRADEVPVERLLTRLRETEGRAQYEVAAGVRTLASQRPDRLRSSTDELWSLLGDLSAGVPLEADGDEPSTGDANALLADGLGDVVGANAALLPAAVERARAADGRDREYALSVVARAARSPFADGECRDYVDWLESLLAERPAIRRRSIAALAGIARDEPRAVEHLLPRVLDALDPETDEKTPETFVLFLASSRPAAFEPHWSTYRRRVRRYDPDSTGALPVLVALHRLASYDRAAIRPLTGWLRRMAASEPGRGVARASADVLETIADGA